MSSSQPVAGVLPVVQLPLDPEQHIDAAILQREIDWVFEQGADGICTGMVTELLRLSAQERNELHRALVQLTAGRGIVVASVGAESTKQAVSFARQAQEVGCQAVMAIPPVSTPLPNEELLRYFQALAEAVELPLIVQDASAYVGQAIDLQVYAELLARYGPEKVLFKPEAAPIGPNLSNLRDRTDGKARVLEGSGGIFLVDSFRRGIVGTIPGADLLDGIVALWRALKQGDEETVYRLYLPLCAIVALQMQAGLDGFLEIEKYILVRRGIFTSTLRRGPIRWQLDGETAAEVDRLMDLLQDALKHRKETPE